MAPFGKYILVIVVLVGASFYFVFSSQKQVEKMPLPKMEYYASHQVRQIILLILLSSD